MSRVLALRMFPFVSLLALVASCGSAATSASSPPATPAPRTTSARTATRSGAASAAPVATTDGAPVTISLAEHYFDPSLITVTVGTTVIWHNVGQQSHDVNARDDSFHSGTLGPGTKFAYTFTKPGRYAYYCIPHEGDGMFGEVDVR